MAENPITAVASLTVDGKDIPAAPTYADRGYTADEDALVLNGYIFTKGRRNVQIIYTAGYTYDRVPYDLRQAIIETASLMYRRRDHLDMATKAMAGEATTYINMTFTPATQQTLSLFRSVVPI
jgi:hypothetical protein